MPFISSYHPDMGSNSLIYVASPIWPSKKEPSLGTFVKTITDGLEMNGWSVDITCVGKTKFYGRYGKFIRYSKLCIGLLILCFKRRGVIYVHLPTWFSLFCWPVLLLRRFPIIVNLHGSEIHSRKHFSKLLWRSTKAILLRSRIVIVPSETFSERVASDVPGLNILISPSGGIDTNIFKILDRKNCRNKIDLDPDKVILGYVSRLVSGKGWKLFLDTIKVMSTYDKDIIGVIVGDGPDRAIIEKEIKILGLCNNIVMVGAIEHSAIPTYMNAFDAFIFTSKIKDVDTLGLVAIESMACGTPVVALDARLTREYIMPEFSGTLAADYEHESFEQAIRRALDLVKSSKVSRFDIANSVSCYGRLTVARSLSESMRKACPDG